LKIQRRLIGLLVVSAAAVLAGCATTGTPPSASATPAPVVHVPALKVAMDCGSCKVRPGVPALIVQGYKDAAAKAGAQISPTAEATLTIKDYTERNDAARFLAGAFAGKDEIVAVVTHQDKKFTVEDYYRNAWLGIDSLASKIGGMAFAQIK
jgi:hypothetical protein